MEEQSLNNQNSNSCKNCETLFEGNYCPNCGQSTKEFAKPIKFLIINFVGNVFAFDTRFWKTFIAVLFKPGALTLDFVKGHRVKYMPPFRFFIFVSFFFFLLLNFYSNSLLKNDVNKNKDWITISTDSFPDSTLANEITKNIPAETKIPKKFISEKQAEGINFLKEHPEVFIEKFYAYFSWVMFILMPFYALLLLIFFVKSQKYYATHFVLAINQHAFAFIVLLIIVAFSLLFSFERVSYLLWLALLIPIYQIIGFKKLYKQKLVKTIFKFLAIIFIYNTVITMVTIMLVYFTLKQTGIYVS